jgi:LacI family transcriptional regulator
MTTDRDPRRQGRRSGVVTLRDVATQAGVHPGTASRALDPNKQWLVQPATRARIQGVARELGYRPDAVARSLRSGQTRTVGVVVADIANPFIAVVIRAIANTLGAQGFLPFVVETQDDDERLGLALDALVGRRVDAVIMTAARIGSVDAIEQVHRRGVPVVLAVRSIPGSGLPSVMCDDSGGARLAAEHLLSLGHTRVLELQGPDDVQSFRDRHASFSAVLRAAGVQPLDLGEAATTPTVGEGRRLMELALRDGQPLPTAIFAHNDAMAVGALEVLESHGYACPADVSLMGYNDAPLSEHLTPPLTTIRYPSAEVGRFAAEVALQHVEDDERPSANVSFPSHLIVRGSTAPPRDDDAGAGADRRKQP